MPTALLRRSRLTDSRDENPTMLRAKLLIYSNISKFNVHSIYSNGSEVDFGGKQYANVCVCAYIELPKIDAIEIQK